MTDRSADEGPGDARGDEAEVVDADVVEGTVVEGTVVEGTVHWRELLAETETLIGDPTHARWICETAASATRNEFATLIDRPATARMVSHLDAMVARSRAGEPIQYVMGSWGFRHLDLAVDDRVLIPRPETELVAEIAIELAAAAGPVRNVADLGTGSGAIGLSMAYELPAIGTTVWLTDISGPALDVARANLAGLGASGVNVRIVQGSWCDPLPRIPAFDVIVANPPYVADGSRDIDDLVSRWEPRSALFAGRAGLDDIRSIVPTAVERLRPGGWLVLEHGHDQGAAVRDLMGESTLTEIETITDLSGHDRITRGRRPLELFEVIYEPMWGGSSPGDLRVRHMANRASDYAHLLTWLTTPDVLEWYEGREQLFDLARILRELGPGAETERDGTIPAIIELGSEPVGYVQLYELDDPDDAAEFDLDTASSGDPRGGEGIWSLDLYIGRPELFGRGIGRAVCRAAAEFMIEEWGARDVVIGPSVENTRAIAAYCAAGFVGDHVVCDHEMHEGRMRDALRLHYRP